MTTITFDESKLDEALAITIDTIVKIAEAVLDDADAEMFLAELDSAFGEMNRKLGIS
jgi:hypothetical protein